MKSIPHLVWFVPAILLIVAATSDLPGGYYTFTRIVTCGIAASIAFTGFRDRPVSRWSIPLALVAVLFNPLIPIHLDRETWVYLDFGAAVVFAAHLLFVRCAPYGLRIRRIFWALELVALVPLVAGGGLILLGCAVVMTKPQPWTAQDVQSLPFGLGVGLFLVLGGAVIIHHLFKKGGTMRRG